MKSIQLHFSFCHKNSLYISTYVTKIYAISAYLSSLSKQDQYIINVKLIPKNPIQYMEKDDEQHHYRKITISPCENLYF
jgi:hypothetical protein